MIEFVEIVATVLGGIAVFLIEKPYLIPSFLLMFYGAFQFAKGSILFYVMLLKKSSIDDIIACNLKGLLYFFLGLVSAALIDMLFGQ